MAHPFNAIKPYIGYIIACLYAFIMGNVEFNFGHGKLIASTANVTEHI